MTGAITFSLFGYTPPSLNVIKTRPGMAARASDRLADELVVRAYQAGWRRGTIYRLITVGLWFPTNRAVDEDNYRKTIKDALVKAGLAKDDSVQALRFRLTVYPGTGTRRTVISCDEGASTEAPDGEGKC